MKNVLKNKTVIWVFTSGLSITTVFVFAFIYLGNRTPDNPDWFDSFVEPTSEDLSQANLSKLVLKVQGLSCSSCIQDIKQSLASFNGIENILVDIAGSSAFIYYNASLIKNSDSISARITEAGYPAAMIRNVSPEELRAEEKIKLSKKAYYIASVGGWELSRSDFDIELGILKTQLRNNYGNDVFKSEQGLYLEHNLKAQVINQLITEGLCLQEIARVQYSIGNEDVEKAYEEYIEDNSLDREGFEEYLASIGYPFEYFWKKFANSVLISNYLEERVFLTAHSDEQKNNLYGQWYNNIKAIVNVEYYDEELQELVINASAASGSCCS